MPAVLERVAREVVERTEPDLAARPTVAALILGGMDLTRDELKRTAARFPAMIRSSAFDDLNRQNRLPARVRRVYDWDALLKGW